MKGHKNSDHLVRNIILAALLAVICIGGVELAACRHFAPETYDRVMAPARYAASVAVDAGKAVLDAGKAALNAAWQFCREVGAQAVRFAGWTMRQASAFWEQLTAKPEEPIPLVVETPPPEVISEPPATEPPITEVIQIGGYQILTGGTMEVVYFCQSDEEWAEQLYGTDPIGPYGCGPTAMAIAVASMTETDTDPAKMSDWAVEHGYWARRSGSYHSIVQGTAKGFGLESESITERTPEKLREVLSSGGMMVALMGKGHFTDGGHFIVLRGVTPDGDILVADPNSLENSLEAWDPQLIVDELSSARNSGAPLWALYKPDT